MLTPSLRVKTLQNSLRGLTLQCTYEILLPNQSSHLSCNAFRECCNEKSPSHLQLSSLAGDPGLLLSALQRTLDPPKRRHWLQQSAATVLPTQTGGLRVFVQV